jgi:hypothetical protein
VLGIGVLSTVVGLMGALQAFCVLAAVGAFGLVRGSPLRQR